MLEELSRQISKAEVRYKERSINRERNIRDIKNPRVTPFEMSSDKRVRERMVYLGMPESSLEAIQSVDDLERFVESVADPESRIALERIIGKSDLMPANFLKRGAIAAACIGRIQMYLGGKRIGFGTGFLVDDRLLLTNNHVLPKMAIAAESLIEMNFEEDSDGTSKTSVVFELDPDYFFVTNKELDYSLVGVKPTSKSGTSLSQYGYIPLLGGRGKVLVGELINIVQHPGGEAKQLAMRENRLIDIFDNYLHYETDTAAGSSGACLFNDQWLAIGIHHAGVPKKDKDGKVLKKNGKVWQKDDPEETIDYFANEGIRLSSILMDVTEQTKQLSKTLQSHVEPLLKRAGPLPIPTPPSPGPTPKLPNNGTEDKPRANPPGGGKSIVIPVNINVLIGSGQSPFKIRQRGGTDREESLRELERFQSREYFNEAQNESNKREYYSGIDFDSSGESLFTSLSELLESTHTNELNYSPGKHLYPWVDLYSDGTIKSVYTEDVYQAEDWINEYFAVEEELQTMHAEMLRRGGRKQADLEYSFLEDTRGYNCEHSVPQNWFSKREPMRGDLHHLFACEMQANGFRSNYPFYDFEDFENPDQAHEAKKLKKGWGMADPSVGFEPFKGKGIVARGSLYFLLRYPGVADDKFRIPMLLRWHEEFPPTLFELHRNDAIFEKQGNRNPFIDFSKKAAAILAEHRTRRRAHR